MGIKRHKPVRELPKGYVTCKEAADMTGYSLSAIYNLIQSRRVTSVRFGRYRYIRESDLKQLRPHLRARRSSVHSGKPRYHWGSLLTEGESALLKTTAESLRVSYSEALRRGLYLLAWSVAKKSGAVPATADLDPDVLRRLVEAGASAVDQENNHPVVHSGDTGLK